MRSLIDQENWVVWRRASAERGGGKVPFRLDGAVAKAARRDDPTGWGTYERARDRYETSQSSLPHFRFLGLGVFLTAELLAVDIDSSCLVSQNKLTLEPWAKEIVKSLPATYTEISPSGTGLKLFYRTPLAVEFDSRHYHNDKWTASSEKKPSMSILRRGFSTVSFRAIRKRDISAVDLSTWVAELQTARATSKLNYTGDRRPTLGNNPSPVLPVEKIDIDHYIYRLSRMERKPNVSKDGSALLLWVVGICVQQFGVEHRESIKKICRQYHRRVTGIPLLAASGADRSIDARIDNIFAKEGIKQASTAQLSNKSGVGTNVVSKQLALRGAKASMSSARDLDPFASDDYGR